MAAIAVFSGQPGPDANHPGTPGRSTAPRTGSTAIFRCAVWPARATITPLLVGGALLIVLGAAVGKSPP